MARVKTGAPGRVRIIGGTLRGSVLDVPARAGLRPTPGRVRETLFNWLQPHLAGARCLDLFAGSGALGVEALSRGAASVDFVERDAGLAQVLRGQLERLRQPKAQVHCANALDWLGEMPTQAYDVVFLDPPFVLDLWMPAAEALEASPWLAQMAWVHVEMPIATNFMPPAAWSEHRQGRAGEVRHVLYRRLAPIH